MVGVAQRLGLEPTQEAEAASVIVINTCGFIDEAKRESIDTILNLAEHKRSGSCQKLVVTGCLSQRYAGEMQAEMPEVDHFLGSSDMLRLADVLSSEAPRVMVGNPAEWLMSAGDPRTLSTRGASAYLKIAEGCNRQCSFCVIPRIRGKQRSRGPGDVLREAQSLAHAGVLELNLVSQDTIAYGRDRSETSSLPALVEQLADVPGIEWIRLHYLYPERLSPRLIALMREHPRVLPYLDMPLQHSAPAMLRRMRRGGSMDLRRTVAQLREQIPGAILRSAFIVGHPGETEEEFRDLEEFVQWAELDHVGVFRYSDEDECHSHQLPDGVETAVAEERAARLMERQRAISRAKNERRVGQWMRVLVEGQSEESEWVMVGRHAGQAPEVDGQVFLSQGAVSPGTICQARVVSATDFDLLAEVDESAPSEGQRRRPLTHLPTLR